MANTKLKFISNVIYKLKRSYGLPIDLYRRDSISTDTETGDKSAVYEKVRVKKAVVLRAREFRSFVYDLAFISANKDFTEGGFFDPTDRRVIIDAHDLTDAWEPKVGDFMIYDNRNYDIKEVMDYENRRGYVLLCREVRGQVIVRTEDTYGVLHLTQTATVLQNDGLTRELTSELNLTQELVEVV